VGDLKAPLASAGALFMLAEVSSYRKHSLVWWIDNAPREPN